MPKFAGIDPSLTRSGVVTYDTDTGEQYVGSFSSSPDKGSVDSKFRRVDQLSDSVVEAVVEGGVPLAVGIEGPAFSSNTGKVWDRAGLWWLVVQKLILLGIDVVEIPPTSRSKLATGNGRAGKDEVLLAVAKNYPDFDIKNNDQADAVVLCDMIARIRGFRLGEETLPKNRLDAVTKLKKDINK